MEKFEHVEPLRTKWEVHLQDSESYVPFTSISPIGLLYLSMQNYYTGWIQTGGLIFCSTC